MGLAEKRAIKEIEDGDLKGFIEQLNTLTGKEISVDVDW